MDREALRSCRFLRQKIGSGVIVLASAEDGKVALITAVTKDLNPKLHAGKIVQELAKLVGGSGGRQTRFGRGWRKRHIRHRKDYRPGSSPPRSVAIIPIAPEAYAGQIPACGTFRCPYNTREIRREQAPRLPQGWE